MHYNGARLVLLSNEILPLLSLKKWRVSARTKEALDPVLRLASRFLTSPASIKYFHAFLFNGRVEDRVATRTWGTPLVEIPTSSAQDAPTWQLTGSVLKNFDELGKHVRFGAFGSKVLPPTVVAATRRRDDDAKSGSDIGFHTQHLGLLTHLHFLDEDKFRKSEHIVINTLLRLRMCMAKTLCHEISHAMSEILTFLFIE